MVEACWCQGGRAAMGTPVARLEMACGLAWFVSDGSWLMLWHWPCYIAGAIAVLTAIAVFFFQDRTLPAILVCCGDTAWLFFNIAWSVGDLAEISWCITLAKVLFALGAVFFLGAFYEGGTEFVLRRVRLRDLFWRVR
jgi:hypothetical protein